MLKRRTFIGTALGAAAVAAMPRTARGHIMTRFPLFDTHAHFYTNDFKTYPVDGSTARYGAEEVKGRIAKTPKTPDTVFPLWDECNITRGAAVQYGSAYLYDNSYIVDIARQHPERLRTICILNEKDPKTPDTIERMARQDKIAGIRFRGYPPDGTKMHAFLSDDAAEVWQTANRLGLAIVLMPHTRTTEDRPAVLARMAELAVRYPNVNIILDHMAFPQVVPDTKTFGFYPGHFELGKLDNVYFKYTSMMVEQRYAANTPLEQFLAFSVATFGADKMMWGSDYGNTAGRLIDLTQWAIDSAELLSLAEKTALFYETADKVHVAGGRGPMA